ncbi:hypothetical protein TcasGA2_TC009135 [Tribolium castaneum]|uniref:Uncharacterized protein n=1 Tax=Tribolium castaneum TaxID=7070 RepID=D6WU32_TRICA|nr:hypothetical protein TcasGA2_TC009135 [Tribolium castaneum]
MELKGVETQKIAICGSQHLHIKLTGDQQSRVVNESPRKVKRLQLILEVRYRPALDDHLYSKSVEAKNAILCKNPAGIDRPPTPIPVLEQV